MDDVQLGVLVPVGQAQWGAGTDPRDLVGFAQRAEALGFDSLFVNDSLLTPRIEPLTMLAALAPTTSRPMLGTGALLPFLRRPVQTAQTLASIDALSGGRLTVAVGAGFPGRFGRPLFDLSDLPWARRFTRLDETVDLWRRMWAAEEPISFHGELLRYDDVPVCTPPVRPGGPPIWLGGATPAALARTARHYDGWLPYPPDPADYRTGLADIRRVAVEAGRVADAVAPALFISAMVTDSVAAGREALDAYAQANYGVGLDALELIQALVAGPADHVAAHLRRYVDAGARHLVVRLAAMTLQDQEAQLVHVAALRPSLG
jgi:alkanesulfonate monooxygenase SsuD/methylene tetrahydromethanopterin reductase-like flavin-dependent oxidoreductase (luciferase family)